MTSKRKIKPGQSVRADELAGCCKAAAESCSDQEHALLLNTAGLAIESLRKQLCLKTQALQTVIDAKSLESRFGKLEKGGWLMASLLRQDLAKAEARAAAAEAHLVQAEANVCALAAVAGRPLSVVRTEFARDERGELIASRNFFAGDSAAAKHV